MLMDTRIHPRREHIKNNGKKELGKIKDTAMLLKEPHVRKPFLSQSVEISGRHVKINAITNLVSLSYIRLSRLYSIVQIINLI